MPAGRRHDAVRQATIRKIEDLWGSDTNLEIITGHSLKMKEIVKEVLHEYRLDIREAEPYENSGVIKTIVWQF